jgi:hypothetical protein
MKKPVGQQPFKIKEPVAAKRRARVAAIIEGLPEAKAISEGDHMGFVVREKRFGWYLHSHHGDGRLAINCRAPRGVAQQLSEHQPDRFHIPKYVAHLGWVGLWLDTPEIDWTEVESVLKGAYRMTAPKSLVARLTRSEE